MFALASARERLRRLMIGLLPVEEDSASLNLVVAARFRRRTLGWIGGCSFKALIRGFDSRRRRQESLYGIAVVRDID
jgi:hypothetical protein